MPSKAQEKVKDKATKPDAAEVTKIKAMLTKLSKATKASELDALLSGATGKDRKVVIDDLVTWLKTRPKATAT